MPGPTESGSVRARVAAYADPLALRAVRRALVDLEPGADQHVGEPVGPPAGEEPAREVVVRAAGPRRRPPSISHGERCARPRSRDAARASARGSRTAGRGGSDARAHAPAERAGAERERLEVGVDAPRVGSGLPSEVEHRLGGVERHDGRAELAAGAARRHSPRSARDRARRARAAPGRSGPLDEPRRTAVAPLGGVLLVDRRSSLAPPAVSSPAWLTDASSEPVPAVRSTQQPGLPSSSSARPATSRGASSTPRWRRSRAAASCRAGFADRRRRPHRDERRRLQRRRRGRRSRRRWPTRRRDGHRGAARARDDVPLRRRPGRRAADLHRALRETLDGSDSETDDTGRQLPLLPVDDPAPVRADRRRARRRGPRRGAAGRVPPLRRREAVRARPRERARARRRAARALPRAPDLPDRPLPREGDGPEHPGAAVREHDLRAACGTGATSTTCRSPSPRSSASSTAARSTSRPARCATSCRTTCMQVLALTAMEPPASFAADPIRDEKVKLLRSVHPLERDELPERVVRAQYGPGVVNGGRGAGLPRGGGRRRRTAPPRPTSRSGSTSTTGGGPACRSTSAPGKRLGRARHRGRARVQAGAVPPAAGRARATRSSRTRLVLRIQPDEGIEISFAAKVPGQAFRVRTVALDFSYLETFAEKAPEAYERVLHDALVGDATLFIRGDEVEQCWRIVQPLVDAFAAGALPLATLPGRELGPARGRRAASPRAATSGGNHEHPRRGACGRRTCRQAFARAGREASRRARSRCRAAAPPAPATSCSRPRPTSTGARVEVFFGDERWVPVHDPDSNEGMARVAFLDEVEPAAIHSMRGAGPTIEAAADAYDDLVRDAPPDRPRAPRPRARRPHRVAVPRLAGARRDGAARRRDR